MQIIKRRWPVERLVHYSAQVFSVENAYIHLMTYPRGLCATAVSKINMNLCCVTHFNSKVNHRSVETKNCCPFRSHSIVRILKEIKAIKANSLL